MAAIQQNNEDRYPLGRSLNTKAALTGVPQFDTPIVNQRYRDRQQPREQALNNEMGYGARATQGHGGMQELPPVAGADNSVSTTPTPPPDTAPDTPPGTNKGPRRIYGTNEYTDADDGRAGRAINTDNLTIVPSFDYAAQLKRLQAIDPEKYGGSPTKSSPMASFRDINPDNMSLGDMASAAVYNRHLSKQMDRDAALQTTKANQGNNEARDALYGAQTDQSRATTEATRLNSFEKRQLADLEVAIASPSTSEEDRVKYAAKAKEIRDRAMREKISVEVAKQKAMMGEPVEGYADGGAIPAYGAAPQMQSPVLAEYGQYLQAAAQSKVQPVPFAQYVNLLSSTRGQMNQTPARFADGGEVVEGEAVDVSGRELVGPGTGTSDSIPAIIDGKRPAALSSGEFVIPAHVVRAKGTEFFDKLLAQYADSEGKDNG